MGIIPYEDQEEHHTAQQTTHERQRQFSQSRFFIKRMIRSGNRVKRQPASGNKQQDIQPGVIADRIGSFIMQQRTSYKIKAKPCQCRREIINYDIQCNGYFFAGAHQRVKTLLPILSNIWWATSIAISPSISETIVLVLFKIAAVNSSSSFLMAFTSGTTGLATAIVFLPEGVSISNAKTVGALSVFNLMISVFLFKKSMPIYASF